MTTVANQKTVNVKKAACNKQNIYATYNLDALQCAMIDLKGETFKLWMYLGKNQNGYTFALSKVDAIKWGIGSTSSYNRAVKELIDKCYLIDRGNNHYDFYEMPQSEYDGIQITINKTS